jgi:hypothetical protein
MRVLVCFVIACAAATPPPRPPRTGAPIACELRDYTIVSVGEYHERDTRTKVGGMRLSGAELVVQAQPGLTAEWLQLQLSRHVEAARGAAPSPDCPLDVDDATVTVRSSGTGFLVRIRAKPDRDAAEILRRTRSFAGVSVAR